MPRTKKVRTVGDLVALLQQHGQSLPVRMARDPEGNGYAPVGRTFYDNGEYKADDGKPCVVIQPLW